MSSPQRSHDQEIGQSGGLNPAVSERTPLLPTPVRSGDPHSETVLDPKSKPARELAPDALRGLLMMLMCIDHTNVNLGVYPHGVGVHNEAATTVVTAFIDGLGYYFRGASHLCASGFAFLLGFGLVYFVSSRAQRKWSASAQVGYIAKRAGAILLVNEFTFLPIILMALGALHVLFWMFNIILPALAIDYFLVGLLVVALDYYVQPSLESLFKKKARDSNDQIDPVSAGAIDHQSRSLVSWGLDSILLTLFFVSAFATIWTAPNQGRCLPSAPSVFSDNFQESAIDFTKVRCDLSFRVFTDFFYLQELCPNLGFISVFPPMAWISFVILGVLYARVILRLKVGSQALIGVNAALGLIFAALFVSTRLLQYGNLSTDCLRTETQMHQKPGSNQYLADLKSFLYVTKYSPDPAFVFLTTSINLLLLAFFSSLFSFKSRPLGALKTVLTTFGVQALFFYFFHQLLLGFLGPALRYFAPGLYSPRDPDQFMNPEGASWSTFFPLYAFVMTTSYFACRSFAAFKTRKGPDSIWRFV
ncbi:hypothetical protein OC846_001111 [Tilletia horrida]|uniref:Heparan-alpha-glucosaminide N-acetyltransferase catalytic domain-containing protein n=1 Tax=Tilletia horrida TaxID=155126 RepID=A0AAN6GTB3_9BASI|nr:hypothetical protein OC846_001111 [Tilletia horrida]KAK0569317.1 hypothetical protein OC861_001029 [Tilletia horrida]